MPSLPQWALSPASRPHANGGTIGFLMSDAKQAEAWHNAGVANGGTSIEDPPVCAQMALISLILVTPIATSSSGLHGRLLDLRTQQKLRRAILFGKALPLWWTPATAGVLGVHQRFRVSELPLLSIGLY